MKAKAIKAFRDKYTKADYAEGQIIEVTQERFEEINSAALGPFVEAVPEEKKPRKTKTTKSTKK